jgi:hypothetical protein
VHSTTHVTDGFHRTDDMLRDLPPSLSHPDLEVFMNTPGAEDEPTQSSTTYVDPFDDVFGSAPPSPALNPQQENADFPHASTAPSRQADHPSDVSRLRSIHVTNGYREGIAASKEKHIQEGFDEGYSLGAEIALKAGRLLGALEGLCHALANQKRSGSLDDTEEAGDYSRKLLEAREEAAKLLREADEELKMDKLFSRQYFGEDGVWIYHVPGQENESEVTFARIAEAHPVITLWSKRLDELCGRLGVVLD